MKRVKVEIEMDEDVVAKVRQFLGLSKEYETAEEVVTEMFYLHEEGFNAVDLRHKVTVTALKAAKIKEKRLVKPNIAATLQSLGFKKHKSTK